MRDEGRGMRDEGRGERDEGIGMRVSMSTVWFSYNFCVAAMTLGLFGITWKLV